MLPPAKPIILAMLIAAPVAQAALVTGWVTTNGDAGFSGGSEATGSPVTTDANGDAIAANFASVTLSDGDSITLSGSFSVNALQSTSAQFRWGLFDGDNPVTAADGLGYVGIYGEGPVNSGSANIKAGDGTATNPFSSGAATSLGAMPNTTQLPADTTVNFLLTIIRDGANLDITSSITDGGSYNSSLTLQDQVVSYYTYDSAAFLLGGTMGGTVATFTNVDVTYTPVPEPSSLALGLGGLALLLRRRR